MIWLLLIVLMPYVYLLLKIYFKLSRAGTFIAEQKSSIFTSVIVACRNEEANLPSLLKDLSEQEYPHDNYEVILVDDNSTDQTFEMASRFGLIKNLKVVHNKNNGKKQAISTGISFASGDLIITTDADCRMGRGWLRAISSFYEIYEPDMIICPVMIESGKGFLRKFQELEFLSLQGVTAGAAMAGDPVMCNGANLAFKKEAYFRYSENLHEELVSGDDVFLMLSIKQGPENKIEWLESEETIVTTRASGSAAAFLKQRARWISKAGFIEDMHTRILAIVTFITILLQVFLLVAGIFDPAFFLIFIWVLFIKSVPDYLILNNRTGRYKKKNLMWFFFPAQILYPFYVISVLVCFLLTKKSYSIIKK